MKSSGFISFRTAEFLWNQAKPTDEKNIILENHGLRAFGIRESFRDGKRMLLVPLADEKGERRKGERLTQYGQEIVKRVKGEKGDRRKVKR